MVRRLVVIVLAAGCCIFGCASGPPVARAQPPGPAATSANSGETEAPALERSALVKGQRFHFRLSLAEQPNLIYHLDCVSGAVFCARAVFQDFWATQSLDDADRAALATWSRLRGRYSGELARTDAAPDPALLMPKGTFDVGERQRIAGLVARTPEAYRSSVGLLSTETDATELVAIIERFAPRFSRWWQADAFARGAVAHEAFARLLADPFFGELLAKADHFYESELPMAAPFEFHLIVQPVSARRFTVAYQLDNHAAIEVSATERPEQSMEILAHEVSHYFFNHTAPSAKAALGSKFTTSADLNAVAAFGVFDEAVACAIGNGLAGRHYRPGGFVAGAPKTGRLTANPSASPIGVALLPALQDILDRGVRISSDEFVATYLAAAQTHWPDGSVPPIEHLRSHVFVGDAKFTGAAQTLLEASLAGFPLYKTFAQLDSSARAFLGSRPYINAAIFRAPDQLPELLDALRPEPKHRAALTSEVARGRPFVYALPRTPKSYAFVFVAGSDREMSELVAGFVAAGVTTPGVMKLGRVRDPNHAGPG